MIFSPKGECLVRICSYNGFGTHLGPESRIHSSPSPNPSSTRETNDYIQSKDFFILFPNRLLRDTSHFIHNFVRVINSYSKLL
ncbi:hypothetical protein Y032_0196g1541 [Ancylostoma ceylanicum]|uniref:Uncharacterized protein n=1 Tax=Ancylostoma ceylanicum TaxID=53326 RepID=A0A016SNJ1_9BILA|nr:hypothetical protein Y032_0196g1541 [Ancylostoma ceylanicum]